MLGGYEVPDLFTHILVAWTVGTILSFRWKQFDGPNISLIMVGSVIPDISKIMLLFNYFHDNVHEIIAPIHLPIGSLVVAGIFSLFFQDKKMTLFLMSLGIATHYILDLMLINSTGGIYLLFPLSWNMWTLNLISNTDYNITIIALIIALMVYLFKNRIKNYKEI